MVVPVSVPAMRAWKPCVAGIREVFHARFTDHAYPPHIHDSWTLFIVDDGAIRYELDRRPGGAGPRMVTILPPQVVHDGRPATSVGFRKRVLYLEPEVLDERLIGPAVDRPILGLDELWLRVAALHDVLACTDDALEAETRFAFVVERIASLLGGGPGEQPGDRGAERSTVTRDEEAEQLRAFLDAHLFEQVTIDEAATAIGASATRIARSFSAVFGVPPHAYVLGRRMEAARERILGGQPLVDVAADVGFCDQAHLSRRFREFLGTTPGRFRRGTGTS